MLASKENHAWLVKEDPEKPAKYLEDVELVEGDPSKITKIGGGLDPPIKRKIVKFLKEYLDVFAQTDEGMPSIDDRVIEHQLNVDPVKKPVQKK